ncbi:hypothetical protein [Sulfurospirillum barnesii]|uniref:Uncharacterized protein n=1 Tax=Sulfurospirillum barnesii (strain ATCC 700032 / DSM 10660 / SES-3) TaxID=760154 RepID=I3XU22_SULBS|nr:hypothetical protein [Sulfurospirillum barnesii]AFL67446.1 hypothetical protein Sulba_0119 [Sulfurospirillum barnesii SES-3]
MEHLPPRIELVPKIHGFWCKVLQVTLYGLLTLTPFGVGAWVGYAYNLWIGIAFFLFFTLVSGVVSSKMRIASIPFEQQEMNYSTMAIVKWYVAKNICLH